MAEIPSTPADGNIRTVVLTTIAGDVPTLSELSAPTTVDISCYLTRGGLTLGVDQATITDERECSTQIFGQPGTKTYTLSLTGIDNTNSPNADEYNELVDVLVEGAQRYIVRRRGKAFDAPFAAGDVVTVIPFKPGVSTEVPPEANSVQRSQWAAFVTGNVTTVELAAA